MSAFILISVLYLALTQIIKKLSLCFIYYTYLFLSGVSGTCLQAHFPAAQYVAALYVRGITVSTNIIPQQNVGLCKVWEQINGPLQQHPSSMLLSHLYERG